VDDPGRSNVSVQHAGALAAVHAFGKRLCSYSPTCGAGLRGPSRIDADNLDTGTCSLVVEHCGQSSPRGIGNGLGRHPTGQALRVQIFDSDPAKAVHQIAGNLMQAIAALVGNASVKTGQRGSPLRFCETFPLAPGDRPLATSQRTGSPLCKVRPRGSGPGTKARGITLRSFVRRTPDGHTMPRP
jgi:hypothetical protein